jgi:PAS domain S-box-containing protein
MSSKQVKSDIVSNQDVITLSSQLDAMNRLYDISTLFIHKDNWSQVLTKIVETAIAISGADFGNIQLLDDNSSRLNIVAHYGFPKWWLDFWNEVHKGEGVCGTALETGKRVIVEDVEQSPIFIGTPALDIQLKAGVHAVQSTPIVSRDGKPLGMFSTHFKNPHRPDDRELQLLDLLANQVADIIERKKAEDLNQNILEELRTTETLLSSITNLSSDVIYIKDRQSRWIFANPALERIVGKSSDDLLGKDDLEIYSNKEIGKTILENDSKIMDSCKEEILEEVVETQDGMRSFISVKTPRFNENGQVIGIVGISHDITNRKQAEYVLRESEEKYRNIIETANEGIMITDPSAIVTFANAKMAEMLGYSIEELVGLDSLTLIDKTELEKAKQRIEDRKKGIKGEYELKFLKKNGEVLWTQGSVSPIYDHRGIHTGNLTMYTDINVRKKAEMLNKELLENEQQLTEELQSSNEELQSTSEELQTSNEELRCTTEELQISNENLRKILKNYDQLNHTLVALRDSSFAMMHAIDEDFYLDEVCRIIIEDCGHSMVWIGFTDEESKKVVPVAYSGFEEDYLRTLNITWDDTERGQGPTGTAIRTGKPSICENMLIDPKFKPWREEAIKRGYASSIVLPIFLNDQVIGALTIYSTETNPYSEEAIKLLQELADDISFGLTALRLRIAHTEAEEALKESLLEVQRSNAELEQFAYITSHDLREPLRMITSFLQLLERRYQDQLDADANEFIGYAVDGAKRLDAMIQDILIYSKITNKERNLNHININNVLEQTYLNLKAAIDENDAHITNDHLPTLKIDEQLMVQLFQNLISNAIKYRRDESPKIHISAKKEDELWVFSVKDNGIGISEKHLEKIFTIFQRLHSHEEYEGTGIGLAIAQKIVHQHNGEIWAESKNGKGTTFYFTIPTN